MGRNAGSPETLAEGLRLLPRPHLGDRGRRGGRTVCRAPGTSAGAERPATNSLYLPRKNKNGHFSEGRFQLFLTAERKARRRGRWKDEEGRKKEERRCPASWLLPDFTVSCGSRENGRFALNFGTDKDVSKVYMLLIVVVV